MISSTALKLVCTIAGVLIKNLQLIVVGIGLQLGCGVQVWAARLYRSFVAIL
jgi:hypothetical protein